MGDLGKLTTHIYADGADKADLLKLYADPLIKGLTTNPTLMTRDSGESTVFRFEKDTLTQFHSSINRTAPQQCQHAWNKYSRSGSPHRPGILFTLMYAQGVRKGMGPPPEGIQ